MMLPIHLMPKETAPMTLPEHLAYRAHGFFVMALRDAGYTVLESRIGDMQFFVVRKGSVARAVVLTLALTPEAAHEASPVEASELEYLTLPAIRAGVYADVRTEDVLLVLPAELAIPEGHPTGTDFVHRLEQWLRRKRQGNLEQYTVKTNKNT